jgi:cob(I)alamin adenosyltransferase
MSIYTKTGDKGKTSIYKKGKCMRIEKTDTIFSLFSKIDRVGIEIGSLLIMIRGLNDELLDANVELLTDTLNHFIQIQSYIMDVDNYVILSDKVKDLEDMIDTLGERVGPLKTFITPKDNQAEITAHRIRVMVREAERKFLSWTNENSSHDEPLDIKRYLNRLSDYFFNLGRYLSEGDHKYLKLLIS